MAKRLWMVEADKRADPSADTCVMCRKPVKPGEVFCRLCRVVTLHPKRIRRQKKRRLV